MWRYEKAEIEERLKREREREVGRAMERARWRKERSQGGKLTNAKI